MATLYQRGGFWWMRGTKNGREFRRTTKTKDLDRAKQIASEFERAMEATTGNPKWAKVVEGWRDDSHSWLNRTFRHIKKRSDTKGWPVHMTLMELEAVTLESDGRCAVTGLPFHLNDQSESRRNPFCISIDRIDSEKGYLIGNVRCVCLIVNLSMSNWGAEAVKTMARALVGAELFQCLVQIPAHVEIVREIEDQLSAVKLALSDESV